MNIAIIPARGGSVRLPRKNVLPFCGHPLISWSIIQAKCSKLINEVYVVTDDEEIAQVSNKYGAIVYMQPEWMKYCNPHAAMACTYVLKEIMKNNNVKIVVPLLCTNPLIKPNDLDNGIKLFNELKIESLRPLQPMRELTLIKKVNDNVGKIEIFAKDYEFLREGGNWTVLTAKKYLSMSKNVKDGESWTDKNTTLDDLVNINYIPVEMWQYSDTDTQEEFEMAEVLMEHYILKGNGSKVYEEYKNAI
jgi:CMP-N-acetylneuraminic acid synthetase